MPASVTGTVCGHTGEKWAAILVFFHVDGVTGGMYLLCCFYRNREYEKEEGTGYETYKCYENDMI